ncbi:hypothetical protein FOXB_06602, partial [Fusarium oxysporum f. sp. conglutinans Fo5176]
IKGYYKVKKGKL